MGFRWDTQRALPAVRTTAAGGSEAGSQAVGKPSRLPTKATSNCHIIKGDNNTTTTSIGTVATIVAGRGLGLGLARAKALALFTNSIYANY